VEAGILGAVPGDLDDELDRLYGIDLAEFVAERTRLARALRSDGRHAEATRVRELRKPSLPAWTVNQLVRIRRKDVDQLLDAAHRVGLAQRALASGGGDRNAFEQARKAEQAALQRLVRAAEPILAERASAATLERVTSTLRAAASLDDSRPDLARGRLTEEVVLTGFEAFGGLPASTGTPHGRPAQAQLPRAENSLNPREEQRRAAEAKRNAVRSARDALKTARAREAALAETLRRAEREQRLASAIYERAAQTSDGLRSEHQAAADGVEAARQKLEEARRG
jgi:hypothetical protein